MKAKLDRTYFWNRQSWGPGEVEIPDDLAIALNLVAQPEPGKSATPPASVAETQTDPALQLINSASAPIALEPLPSIGKATAKTILERRPKGGYTSLDQARELNADKTFIDWKAIAAWRAE